MMFKKIGLDKKYIGSKIKHYIKSSSYTIDEIAEALELNSSRVIYCWFNGDKLPTIENLYNLSILLEISIEEILTDNK